MRSPGAPVTRGILSPVPQRCPPIPPAFKHLLLARLAFSLILSISGILFWFALSIALVFEALQSRAEQTQPSRDMPSEAMQSTANQQIAKHRKAKPSN